MRVILLAAALLLFPVTAFGQWAISPEYPIGNFDLAGNTWGDSDETLCLAHHNNGHGTSPGNPETCNSATAGNGEEILIPVPNGTSITRAIIPVADYGGTVGWVSTDFLQFAVVSVEGTTVTTLAYSDKPQIHDLTDGGALEYNFPDVRVPDNTSIAMQIADVSAATDDDGFLRGRMQVYGRQGGGQLTNKLLFAGDSIVRGTQGPASCTSACVGYRPELLDLLNDAGLPVNMVGDNDEGDFYDSEHYGISSRRADQVATNIVAEVNQHTPDTLWVAAGINDCAASDTPATVVSDLEDVVTNAQGAASPPSRIIIQALIFITDSGNETCRNAVNALLPAMAAANGVEYADGFEDLISQSELSADNVHPNEAGYTLMAAEIARVILGQ